MSVDVSALRCVLVVFAAVPSFVIIAYVLYMCFLYACVVVCFVVVLLCAVAWAVWCVFCACVCP